MVSTKLLWARTEPWLKRTSLHSKCINSRPLIGTLVVVDSIWWNSLKFFMFLSHRPIYVRHDCQFKGNTSFHSMVLGLSNDTLLGFQVSPTYQSHIGKYIIRFSGMGANPSRTQIITSYVDRWTACSNTRSSSLLLRGLHLQPSKTLLGDVDYTFVL